MRRRTIMIHVGAHRTGTTYLQATFANNREALAERNIRYLSFHRFREHRQAFLRARYALRDGNLDAFRSEFAPIAKLLSEQVAQYPDQDFLISYEGFLGDLSLQRSGQLYPVHAALLTQLLQVFDGEQVHVAFAIREYGAFVESGYKYLVQTGLRVGFRRYTAALDQDHISWLPIVRSLTDACGRDLSLWAYEDFARSPERVIDWLFDRGFASEASYLTLPNESRNASVSRGALPALLLYNRVVRARRKSSNAAYNLLLRFLPASRWGHPRLFDKAIRDRLRQRYREDIAAIRDEFPDFYSAPANS